MLVPLLQTVVYLATNTGNVTVEGRGDVRENCEDLEGWSKEWKKLIHKI